MTDSKIRPIAIHLPQFHPIPENDEWWGKGFTEWTNVTKAKPLYKGHYQPHLPADLGFYDLRLPEARQAQADLARKYGIYGFCYYHYWFNGRRILERPIQEITESGKPDFPFMFCWANENWTRVWDGGDKNILLQQFYSTEDDLNHIRALIPYFKDPRYIKINGKPVFAIYRSTLLPDIRETIATWRREAERHGVQLYICRFESHGTQGKEYMSDFDAAIEFQPHTKPAEKINTLKDEISLRNIQRSITFRSRQFLHNQARELGIKQDPTSEGMIIPYKDQLEYALQRSTKQIDYKLFRGVCPGWDNSPRRKRGYLILDDSSPKLFEQWTREALKEFRAYSEDENLFFINAWNEWGEGNHLEPCQKWGHAYLEALQKGLSSAMKRFR